MFDFTRFSIHDLHLFGITFFSDTEARKFVEAVKNVFYSKVIALSQDRMLRDDRQKFQLIKGSENQFSWLKKNYSQYKSVASRITIELGWKVLRLRDTLTGAVIDHSFEKGETPLSDLTFLSQETCDFLYFYGLDTVGDVIAAGDLFYLQRTYPRKVGDFLRVVLEYIIPAFSAAYSEPEDAPDKDLMFVFDEALCSSPDKLLSILSRFIGEQTQSFRDGEQSEEQYLDKTYPFDVFPLVLSMKYFCCPETSVKDVDLLKKAYETYRQSGTVEAAPWMNDFLSQLDGVAPSMTWFFQVADALMIPMEHYLSLDGLGGYLDYQDAPEVIRKAENTAENSFDYFVFNKNCLNIDELLRSDDPIGKSFLFRFPDGTTAEFLVETADLKMKRYTGKGIISGYMEDADLITIRFDGSHYRFCFDRRLCDSPHYYLQKEDHPIPHPRWDQYNKAQKEKKAAVAKAYRALVLQTVKGSASDDPD